MSTGTVFCGRIFLQRLKKFEKNYAARMHLKIRKLPFRACAEEKAKCCCTFRAWA